MYTDRAQLRNPHFRAIPDIIWLVHLSIKRAGRHPHHWRFDLEPYRLWSSWLGHDPSTYCCTHERQSRTWGKSRSVTIWHLY
jgi:hypothetical protein